MPSSDSGSVSPPPPSPDQTCLSCAQAPIEYMGPICRHPSLCKRCAMQQATGGKCKVCGELFAELKRV